VFTALYNVPPREFPPSRIAAVGSISPLRDVGTPEPSGFSRETTNGVTEFRVRALTKDGYGGS